MTSKLVASAVFAATALTSIAAAAETFNPYLWDQMKAPVTKTRAEVRAEALRAQQGDPSAASQSAYNSVVSQPAPPTARTEKPGAAPQTNAASIKTSAQ